MFKFLYNPQGTLERFSLLCFFLFSSSKSKSSTSSTTTTTNKDNSVAQGTGGKVATDGGTLADTIAEENATLTQTGASDSGFIVSEFSGGSLTVETTDDELALAIVAASENLANRAVDSGKLAFDNALRATQQAGEVAQNAFEFATNDESQLGKWAIIAGAVVGALYFLNR